MKRTIKKAIPKSQTTRIVKKSSLKIKKAKTLGNSTSMSKTKKSLNGFKYVFLNTKQSKINCLKRHGNIITFKKPYIWQDKPFTQIIVRELKHKTGGNAKIIGIARETPTYKSIEELLKVVDWKYVEEVWQYEAQIKGQAYVKKFLK